MQATGRTPLTGAQAPILAGGVAALGLALDQVTKSLAVEHLEPGASKHLVGSLLQLHLTRNPGAAFSTGTSMTVALACIAIAAAVAVAVVVAVRARSLLWAIGLGFLEAGILGNVADRLFREPAVLRGHVVDFLQLPHWPIFNVADICITTAAALIILQAWRGIRLDGSRETADETA